jgi:hypothetical protein
MHDARLTEPNAPRTFKELDARGAGATLVLTSNLASDISRIAKTVLRKHCETVAKFPLLKCRRRLSSEDRMRLVLRLQVRRIDE